MSKTMERNKTNELTNSIDTTNAVLPIEPVNPAEAIAKTEEAETMRRKVWNHWKRGGLGNFVMKVEDFVTLVEELTSVGYVESPNCHVGDYNAVILAEPKGNGGFRVYYSGRPFGEAKFFDSLTPAEKPTPMRPVAALLGSAKAVAANKAARANATCNIA
jgi:hypothetical protein